MLHGITHCGGLTARKAIHRVWFNDNMTIAPESTVHHRQRVARCSDNSLHYFEILFYTLEDNNVSPLWLADSRQFTVNYWYFRAI